MFRAFTAILFLVLSTGATSEQLSFFTVGSGDVTGGYFSVASAICAMINEKEKGGTRCSPDPSSGSLYNLAMLKKGELDFALVQSDWHRHAFEGTDIFSDDAAMPMIRSVMGLYPESITIIAARESGITKASELIGKRVDIGRPSSGRFASLSRLFELLGVKLSDFGGLSGFTQDRAVDELCGGHIDATILIVGHPNDNVARALSDCGARLIAFDNSIIETNLRAATDFRKVWIHSGTYPDVTEDVRTFAVYSTIVTRADASPELVETFVMNTLQNLNALSLASPVLTNLTAEGLRTNGLTAPLHQGAKNAYAEFTKNQESHPDR